MQWTQRKLVLSLAGLVILASINPASAMNTGSDIRPLQAGTSAFRYLPRHETLHRYALEIDSPQRVEIRSRDVPAAKGSPPRLTTRAELIDEAGDIVARGDGDPRHFRLVETLAPGEYTLRVYGIYRGPANDQNNRYAIVLQDH